MGPNMLASYLGDMGEKIPDIKQLQARIYQKVLSMTPQQRDAYWRKMKAVYNRMPAKQKAYAKALKKRLAMETPDPREPSNLGSVGSTANIIASVTQGLTAITGAYFAYEGLQQQKDAQSAAQKREQERLDMERKMMEEQLAAQRQQREAQQRMLEAQLKAAEQAPSGGSAPSGGYMPAPAGEKILGMDKKVATAVGAGVVGVTAVLLMKG
jgi:hypothetical protein